MHEPTPIPIHELPTDPDPSGEAPGTAVPPGVEQAIDVLIGLVTLATNAAASILRGDEEPGAGAEGATLVTGAAAGFLIEGLRAAGAVLTAFERTLVAPATTVAGAAAERPEIRELLEHWQASWEEQRDQSEPVAADTLRRGIRRGADALMDQLDLTQLVIDHLDIQRVAEQIDIDALVGGLDIDRLIDRMDMDRLASRIDIDALVARLDVEAVVDNLDVAAIAADVIDELDLPQLIRDATADITSDGVRTARLRGVGADRALRRAVDRILARSEATDTGERR
ncbi:MAG: hypothetical protein ABJB55_00230 [Actinomycetota bacterium]